MLDPTEAQNEQFVARMTAAQPGLFAFVLTLAPNATDARDILSETNLALWKKRSEYDATLDFWPWACRFARLQVLAFRKRQQRDRLVLTDEVVSLVAAKSETAARTWQDSFAALESCLSDLDESRVHILRRRYTDGLSVAQIADELEKTAGSVADLLYRLRLRLASCIERKLATEGQS
ncbi:sigma-70 family RNA polymerase sigma factor [Blastopirellula sp. J2-11]|uniref:sigma-70 family RNA polymerase sigma factor n=1 Tax=Blastopirellula sp. J2-11 TaxID=2943192 RepID=UPI0021C86E6A|nr:sigma-70 family RNA polymerase sigma factor [Blastopirellula sp. J2-11]UUO06131.1 sigma-70 family RNA polymerase sigma factor [Blastopirellula sp. J2-11]